MATYKKAISGFGLRFLGLFSSYVFTFLVNKYYSVQNWGNFTFTLTIISFLVLLVKFGIDLTLLKFTTRYISRGTPQLIKLFYLKSLKPLLFIGIILTAALYFSSDFICNYISKPQLIPFLKIGAFAVVPLAFSIINAEGIRGFEKSDMYIFIQFVGMYLFASLIFLYINNIVGLDMDETVIIAFTVSCVIIFIVSSILLQKLINQNNFEGNNDKESIPAYKDLFVMAFPFFITNMMVVLIDWTDILLLGFNIPSGELGQFNLTLKISNLMLLPVMVAATIIGPRVALAFEKNDKEDLRKEAGTAVKITLILGILTFAGLIIGWPVINYVFEEKVAGMFWVFVVLISGQFVTTLLGPNDIFLQLTGNQVRFQRIMLISAAFNVITNMICIPLWGVWAACIVNLFTKLIWNLSAYYYFKKHVF